MLRRFADHVARSILARSPRNEDGAVLDLLCLAVFGALAGLSMGLWTGGVHLLYVATKVPLLLGGSLLIGFPSMLVLGRILGCPLGPGETARLALATVARTAVVLGALAPASAVFSVSLSSGGAGHYRTVVMVQVFDFTLAGLVGVSALHGRLGSLLPDRRARRRTVVLWVGIYSFVGALFLGRELSGRRSPPILPPPPLLEGELPPPPVRVEGGVSMGFFLVWIVVFAFVVCQLFADFAPFLSEGPFVNPSPRFFLEELGGAAIPRGR